MGAADPLLTFDEATHVYRVRGAVVPGVTTILRPLIDFSKIKPEVLEAKRDLGQRVHQACQFDDEGDLDESSIEHDVAPYFSAWRKFLAESGARVVHNEQQVYEPTLCYAGTLDNVLELQGKRWLVDKKTSFAVPMSAGPQTAAYLRALGDSSVTHRGAVRLRPDGTYRFDQLHGSDDWAVFLSCLTLMRFRESHADR
jgi:hypothetical protein